MIKAEAGVLESVSRSGLRAGARESEGRLDEGGGPRHGLVHPAIRRAKRRAHAGLPPPRLYIAFAPRRLTQRTLKLRAVPSNTDLNFRISA